VFSVFVFLQIPSAEMITRCSPRFCVNPGAAVLASLPFFARGGGGGFFFVCVWLGFFFLGGLGGFLFSEEESAFFRQLSSFP